MPSNCPQGYFYEVDSELKTEDITGHTTNRAVAAAFESNYLSGTAIAVRPDAYPLGADGCLYPPDIAVIRDILAGCEGTVRWGGDASRPRPGRPGPNPHPRPAHLPVNRPLRGGSAGCTPG
ncbi:hypothetical protein [Streptomyces sp. NPDC048637]|uniref:hypothetical protein n=1 Tax=Streptomyces sp. NPDC048637 TaxID=3155636 RepID=UPI00342FE268